MITIPCRFDKGYLGPGFPERFKELSSGNSEWQSLSFQIGNEQLSVMARKSMAYAEAYTVTPHK